MTRENSRKRKKPNKPGISETNSSKTGQKRVARSRLVDKNVTPKKKEISKHRSKSTSTRRVILKPDVNQTALNNNATIEKSNNPVYQDQISLNQIQDNVRSIEQAEDEFFNDQVVVSVDPAQEDDFNTDVEEDSDGEIHSDDEEVTLRKSVAETEVMPSTSMADTEMSDFSHLEKNPAFAKYISTLVAKEVNKQTTVTMPVKTPQKRNDKPSRRRTSSGNHGNFVKSPSDTTIYAPVLQRDPALIEGRSPVILTVIPAVIPITPDKNIAEISKFIEGIHVQSEVHRVEQEERHHDERDRDRQSDGSAQLVEQQQPTRDLSEIAKEKADRLIIEAEKFKAAVNTPQGISANVHYANGMVKDDDEFFHITCHVDTNTIARIERGEFVELEKLLPKKQTTVRHGTKVRVDF